MTRMLRLLLVAGARPNFMKVAPLVWAIHRHNVAAGEKRQEGGKLESNGERTVQYRLVHTGQHYDDKMSEVFFRELGIPAPDFNLEVGSGSHAVQTARIMERFEPVLLNAFSDRTSDLRPPSSDRKPDWLVVVGDVNSTMACTLVAAKLGIKVAHVEAGLRSFDRTMPEEINRIVTDSLADLLLTPSEDANENLRREGVPKHRIRLVGNIMIDSLVHNLPAARQSRILADHGLERGRFVYVTLHRPSNVDQRESLTAIMGELIRLSQELPVVFPVHPRTRKMAAEFGLDQAGNGMLRIIDPIGYRDSLCLSENARLVLTDSGGLQEETTYFRTPCLTLRPNTERPVTVTHGSNRLTTTEHLRSDIVRALNGGHRSGIIPPWWDGQTAGRVLGCLMGASVLHGVEGPCGTGKGS